MVKKTDRRIIESLNKQAQSSDRKRKNLNYHVDFSDPINRMLNAIEPGSYIQPHKHENPDKREVFIRLTGRLLVVFFDDLGTITDHCILDGATNFAIEIPPSVWHSLVSLEPGTVVYEIKDGPYSPSNDKNFAGWAPREGDPACNEYVKQILNTLKIF